LTAGHNFNCNRKRTKKAYIDKEKRPAYCGTSLISALGRQILRFFERRDL